MNNGVTSSYSSGYYYIYSNPVFDSSGNMYIADSGNNVINKVTSAGVKSQYAGSYANGSSNGTSLTTAQFSNPQGMAIDGSGTIYVADTSNNRIRMITSTTVSYLAGSGTQGNADGTGTGASFYYPAGIVLDGAGNLYVADRGNHSIRKIVISTGVVTTIAGGTAGDQDGTGSGAQLGEIWFMVKDGSGNLIVTDSTYNKIKKITPAGVVTTVAGSGTAGTADGSGTSATFNRPMGIARDTSGTFYISDNTGNKIRQMTSSYVVTTLAGSGTAGNADGTGTGATFRTPNGLGLDASNVLYVVNYTDASNAVVRKVQ